MLSYGVFAVSGFVAFVVNMAVLFQQVELDPVVETHDLLSKLGFSHKHMFKPTGILSTVKTTTT